MPKKRKIAAVGALSLIAIIAVDMLVGRSPYHPLGHVYKLLSWSVCLTSEATCQYDQTLSSLEGEAAVVTSHHEATRVGIEILKSGGNAIDAASAIGYALAVVHPCCGNIGGGGFMTIRLSDGKTRFINFRETAPSAATSVLYQDEKGKVIKGLSTDGYLAVAVPGTVAGLEYAREKYGSGTLTRSQLIEPARKLAAEGFVLSKPDQSLLDGEVKGKDTDSEIIDIFTNQGEPLEAGDRLVQNDLAKTLALIAKEGESAFYRGDIAKKIVEASQENNGILTLKDFEAYRVQDRAPLTCDYRGFTVVTSPPPGGGAVLCQMLKIVEGYPVGQTEYHSAEHLHWMLSAMLFAYRDRNLYFGDPDFVEVPVDRLLSDEHAEASRAQIPIDTATKLTEKFPKGEEGQNTTHFSVVDREGNAVSVTYTINTLFGASVIAPDTGVILNNEMDDFTAKVGVANTYGLVQSNANSIEPSKRPLSSMAPTIVLDADNDLYFVTGSPGGSTIPTTVFQIVSNLIDFDMEAADAVNQPRVHYQGTPNVVLTEPFALSTNSFVDLWDYGYRVFPFINWGAAMSISQESEGSTLQPVQDIRRTQGKASVIETP